MIVLETIAKYICAYETFLNDKARVDKTAIMFKIF